MTDAFRAALKPAVQVVDGNRRLDNPGLVLDRYQCRTRADADAMGRLLDRVCSSPPPPLYRDAFAEWRRTILALPGVRAQEFGARTRLIVGLGSESVRETGITLLRPYGVPVLPGSALKGLARRYAQEFLDPSQRDALRYLFGEQAMASYLTYLDAWYVPDSAPGDQPLCRDVITVHHPRYYASQGKDRAPWDFDDPNPVPFIAAQGRYLVAVLAPDAGAEWAEQALRVLTQALGDWGIGGKTSSGYGRLDPHGPRLPLPPEAEAAQGAAQKLIDRIRALTPAEAAERVDGIPRLRSLYEEARELADEAMQTAAYRAIRDKLEEAGVLKQWQTHPWVRNLLARLKNHP